MDQECAALRDSEVRSSPAAELAEPAVFVLDPDGRTLFCNASAAALHETHSTAELDTALHEGTLAEDRWCSLGDGTRVAARVTVTPLWNEAGEVRAYSKVIQFAAQDLHTGAGEPALVWTIRGGIECWNAAAEKLYGWREEEALGRSPDSLLRTQTADPIDEVYATMRELGKWEGELHQQTQEGRQIVVSSRRQLVRDSTGSERVLETVRDLTNLRQEPSGEKRMNEELECRVARRTAELEAANAELEAFTYSVSHDLRAPLRAIRGFAEILAEEHGHALDEAGRHSLGVVRGEVARMSRLVDDLLSFSRLGRAALAFAEIDLSRVVGEICSTARIEPPGRSVEFHIGDLPRVVGDEATITQALVNLISNAVKFTRHRQPAIIHIGGRVDSAETVIWVQDNGAGFEMRYASRLFGVFQRMHRTEEFEGTGVGLAIVRSVVQRHGGRVWAEAAPDRGATFFIALPTPSSGDPAFCTCVHGAVSSV